MKPKLDTKRCPKCARVLPIDAFWRSSKAKDGHEWVCKECKSKMASLRYYEYGRTKQPYPFAIIRDPQFEPPRWGLNTGQELCEVCPQMIECRTRAAYGMPVLCEWTDEEDLVTAEMRWPGEGRERLGL